MLIKSSEFKISILDDSFETQMLPFRSQTMHLKQGEVSHISDGVGNLSVPQHFSCAFQVWCLTLRWDSWDLKQDI
jgi:hypothetical protein